jgi:very-short-patch-repair endonuclease
MSTLPLFVLVFLVVIVVIGAQLPKRRRVDTPRKRFQIPHIPRRLMPPSEKEFFKKLYAAGEPWELIVAPQVAMSAIGAIPKKYNDNLKYRHKNRAGFAQKRLDFVLLDSDSLEPVLVVELEDQIHDNREDEDAQRNEILAETGYPLLRIAVRERLTTEQLTERIAEVLEHP